MTEVQLAHQESWWSSSSWFAGGGLQEAAATAAAQPAVVPAAAPGDAEALQHPEESGIISVGGARAQSRFSGRTAIPIATCAPLSSAGRAAAAPAAPVPAAPAPPQRQPAPAPHPGDRSSGSQSQLPAAPLLASARHAAWAGRPAGHTIDGSTPDHSGSVCGEHVSRWVFDTALWQWRVRDGQPCAPGGGPSDKHQLAARRWGDSRDALGAAVLGLQQAEAQQQQQQGAGSGAGMAAAASGRPGAAPAKRQRLHVGAMTGDTSDAGWAAVGGLQKQKDALMEAVAYPLAHPRLFARLGAGGARGVLLHGPPGSGKTHLVRALAAQARLGIVVLNGGECVGEEAEKRLKSAFNQAKSQAPSILLLDELDALAPSRAAATSEHERQATARLLAAVDELRASRARVALVGATNRREAVEPALRRAGRLDCEVALGALQPEERAEVLRCCTARMPLAPGVQVEAVAARLRGYVAADVAAVAAEAALLCAVEAVRAAEAAGRHVPSDVEEPGFLESLRVSSAHFEAAVERLGPAVLRGLAPEVPAVRWDDIGGLQEAKAALRELVELPLAHGHLLQAYGLPPPRGALLYGPPGCGKTLLAKAAANECGANFLSIRGPELLSKWLGESEAAVRRVFDAARQAAPCCLFFDEFDSVGGRRSAGGSSGGGDAAAARVLNQLLVEMDGLTDRGGVFVLAATNRPEALDPALTRPGRLDHLLRVPLPDAPARAAILAASLARCPLAADVDLAGLAGEATEGLSGADLAEVCRRAGMAAIRELVAAEEAAWAGAQHQAGAAAAQQATAEAPPLQQRHLLAALSGMRPSVSAAESQRHAAIEQRLQEGSLEAPDGGADRRLAALVRQAAAGSLQSMQERVAQLEAALRCAGLEVPPQEA